MLSFWCNEHFFAPGTILSFSRRACCTAVLILHHRIPLRDDAFQAKSKKGGKGQSNGVAPGHGADANGGATGAGAGGGGREERRKKLAALEAKVRAGASHGGYFVVGRLLLLAFAMVGVCCSWHFTMVFAVGD